MEELSEVQIQIYIKKAKRGNRQAFDRLVEYYEQKVYNFAYKLSMNRDEALDITVETFTRVFKSISGFRHEANFKSWMFTIVKNVYLDRLKVLKKNQHQSLDQDIETGDGNIQREIRDAAQTPEETLLEKEKLDGLTKVIDSLPTEQAIVIKMYHLEELGYEEISEILNIPIGTVKSRINRGRKNLEDKIKKFND